MQTVRGIGFWLIIVVLIATRPCSGRAAGTVDCPQEVRTGFFVTSISGVDFADGSFKIVTIGWFVDPDGTFDPMTQLEVPARAVTMKPLADFPLDDGSRFRAVEIEATVDHTFNTADFPFERQTLRL